MHAAWRQTILLSAHPFLFSSKYIIGELVADWSILEFMGMPTFFPCSQIYVQHLMMHISSTLYFYITLSFFTSPHPFSVEQELNRSRIYFGQTIFVNPLLKSHTQIGIAKLLISIVSIRPQEVEKISLFQV